MFFLHFNLGKEEKKPSENLSTKPRSEILEDYFNCNSSIFHNMDTFSMFDFHVVVQGPVVQSPIKLILD